MKMNLSIDLEALVNEELDSLQLFSNKVLKIPISRMRRYIGSYFLALLYEGSATRGRSIEKSKELDQKATQQHYADFDKLCKSVPHVPKLILRMISMAYGSLGMLYAPGPEGRFIENNESEVIATLMLSSFAQGTAKTAFAMRPGGTLAVGEDEAEAKKRLQNAGEALLAEFKASQSRRLSDAGRLGAQAKNRRSNELKDWVRERAVGMRDDDKTIARKLFAQLPDHLADVSNDPTRLIYDTLRAKKNLS